VGVGTDLPIPSVCLSVCLSVDLSVRKVYCGKTDDWIWILFGLGGEWDRPRDGCIRWDGDRRMGRDGLG